MVPPMYPYIQTGVSRRRRENPPLDQDGGIPEGQTLHLVVFLLFYFSFPHILHYDGSLEVRRHVDLSRIKRCLPVGLLSSHLGVYWPICRTMRVRWAACAAIFLVVAISVLLFEVENSKIRSSKHLHRLFLSHRAALLPLPKTKAYAYVLFATGEQNLCNCLVNAQRLVALKVTDIADIVVLYNDAWDGEENVIVDRMFTKLKALQVKLVGVQLVLQTGDPTWREGLTKLKMFTLTEYRKVIFFDADGLVMKNMNHLFSLPATPIAMPRAYWLEQPFYSAQIAVLEPSEKRLKELLAHAERTGGFDMDALNDLYKGMCMVLPNEYDLLSGELRKTDHAAYLGNSIEVWNATAEVLKASYIHFSDYPIPKPWRVSAADLEAKAPACPPYCDERRLWIFLYTAFQDAILQCKLTIS